MGEALSLPPHELSYLPYWVVRLMKKMLNVGRCRLLVNQSE